MNKSFIGLIVAAAVGLSACATLPTTTSTSPPITGSTNLASAAATILAACQTACGIVGNSQTAGDIQNLITNELSAGAYVTYAIVQNLICTAVGDKKLAMAQGKRTGGNVVNVTANGVTTPIHYAAIISR